MSSTVVPPKLLKYEDISGVTFQEPPVDTKNRKAICRVFCVNILGTSFRRRHLSTMRRSSGFTTQRLQNPLIKQ